ncbi:MAG: hypothetical protein KDD51_13255 [Bdellovibrionales bacterium]|nr:hypothetical protein [Bdellovibrionales bacterium]
MQCDNRSADADRPIDSNCNRSAIRGLGMIVLSPVMASEDCEQRQGIGAALLLFAAQYYHHYQ